MQFEEVKTKWKNKEIDLYIDHLPAGALIDMGVAGNAHRYALHLWSTVALFAIAGGLISIFWIGWWGLGITFFGYLTHRAQKQTNRQVILNEALQNQTLFNQLVKDRVITINEK